MGLKDQSTLRVVLYEGEGSRTLEPEERLACITTLLEKGYALTRAAQAENSIRTERNPLLVLGCFDEPPHDVRHPDQVPVYVKDITGLTSAEVAGLVDEVRHETRAAAQGDWKPWFPVIDYDRCTNCMQCLSFCLFGVYGVDEQQVIQVQNNDNCKTNCPACSRVCPEAAIMFPKYKAGPINGEPVKQEDLDREKMKVDISALLGGDVYQALRDRSAKAKSRFSKERDSNKALTERQKCLAKLKEAAQDIPPEVLMSLPSPEEIQRRAHEAQAKADAARQAQSHNGQGSPI